MFYYGRTVRRLESFEEIPSSEGSAYCILDGSEWREWWLPGTAVVIERLRDEQGDPIVLVRVSNLRPRQDDDELDLRAGRD